MRKKQPPREEYPKVVLHAGLTRLVGPDGTYIEFIAHNGQMAIRLSKDGKTDFASIVNYNDVYSILRDQIIIPELEKAAPFDFDEDYVDPKGIQHPSRRKGFPVKVVDNLPESKPLPPWLKET